jgi:hypothetical protein
MIKQEGFQIWICCDHCGEETAGMDLQQDDGTVSKEEYETLFELSCLAGGIPLPSEKRDKRIPLSPESLEMGCWNFYCLSCSVLIYTQLRLHLSRKKPAFLMKVDLETMPSLELPGSFPN